jgi:hypothetical protein
VRTTTAPYTESRLAHLVRNRCVGFPVVEHVDFFHGSAYRLSINQGPQFFF